MKETKAQETGSNETSIDVRLQVAPKLLQDYFGREFKS